MQENGVKKNREHRPRETRGNEILAHREGQRKNAGRGEETEGRGGLAGTRVIKTFNAKERLFESEKEKTFEKEEKRTNERKQKKSRKIDQPHRKKYPKWKHEPKTDGPGGDG